MQSALRRDIGGLIPTQTNEDQNPNIQNAMKQFQQMTPEQLQIAALKYGDSPQGQIAQKILQQKRMMPTGLAPPQNPLMAAPGMAQQPGMAEGGFLRRADGGMSPGMESPWWERSEARGAESTGYLNGPTLGRADALKTTAPAGSYVIPADVVSGLGEGNSLAGARIMEEAMGSGPWGTKMPRGGRGNGPPRPPAAQREAKGGGVQKGGDGSPIPVMLSHGEYVISPDKVAAIGGGNQKSGWRVLDHFVLEMRKRHIDKLKKLPGPAK